MLTNNFNLIKNAQEFWKDNFKKIAISYLFYIYCTYEASYIYKSIRIRKTLCMGGAIKNNPFSIYPQRNVSVIFAFLKIILSVLPNFKHIYTPLDWQQLS